MEVRVMFSWLKFWKLDESMRARIEACRGLLANTMIIPVRLYGGQYNVEVLIIPPRTETGKLRTPKFIYPGGGTDLFLCIEPALYSDRETIIISPLGYGNSSDIPDEIFQNYPLHGAVVILQVLQALGKLRIILSAHSNAGPIVTEATPKLLELGIEVEGIELTNPLGLRWFPWPFVLLAFGISGGLTKLISLLVEHPVDLLKGAYIAPKHKMTWSKFWYEIMKSCVPRLPDMFRQMKDQELGIPFLAVISYLNWASLHLPWRPSDKKILMAYIPGNLLTIERIFDLHNPTLGPGSRILAKVTEKTATGISLVFILLPQIPVWTDWLTRGLGFA